MAANYDVLRIGGAAVLVVLGLRSLFARAAVSPTAERRAPAGSRAGLITSTSDPKLAALLVALFP